MMKDNIISIKKLMPKLPMDLSSETAYNSNNGGGTMDVEKLYDFIRQDIAAQEQRSRDLEQRIMEDRREAEARMDARFAAMDERIETRHREAMDSMRELKNDLRADMIETKAESRETKRWMLGTAIATILGIAAMVLTVFQK